MDTESPGYQALQGAINGKKRLNLLFYGYLGLQAGGNWYDINGNMGEAVMKGAYCAFRWKLWFGCLCVWALMMFPPSMATIGYVSAMFQGESPDKGLVLALVMLGIAILVGIPSVGVTYVYNTDLSLFHQRWAYRRFYRLAWHMRNIHWAVLHSILIVPIVVPFGILMAISAL